MQVFKNEVQEVLAKQFYNAGDGTNGMENLLDNHATALNGLTMMKSLATATRQAKLAASWAETAIESTTSTSVAPDIDTNADTQDETDHQNMLHLAVIGAKKGLAAGVAIMLGKPLLTPSCAQLTQQR